MIQHNMDVIRLNLSWGTLEEHTEQIAFITAVEKELGRQIPIVIDLPGPRTQGEGRHSYDAQAVSAITERDKELIRFGVGKEVDYIAVSFVGGPADIEKCREIIASFGGKQRVIAKIERRAAVASLERIIQVADAVMIARGDLGNEVPIEEIPFIQARIVEACKKAGKPVIVATGMLLSMVGNPEPTRAEVTDVEAAIMEGADAVMLSEETAKGRYPVEAVTVMERIVLEAEKHLGGAAKFNHLQSL